MKKSLCKVVMPSLLMLVCAFPASAAERDAVIVADGCTAFVVDGNLLVTAKHCQHPQQITVTIQGQSVIATKAFASQNEDGPVVFRLSGGPFASLPVSDHAPKMGDAIYTMGYPGGNWARIEGKLLGGNGEDTNYTDHRVATGNSGGPLLNSDGEVIGVTLFVDAEIAVHRSGFAGWRVTSDAITQAGGGRPQQRGPPQGKPVIVVFTSERCGPCEALKRDVKAGHFDEYEFKFIEWKNGKWSDGDVEYRAFWEAANPKERLQTPTIWIKGTKNYKVGYDTKRRGGLLGWLRGAVRFIGGLFIGERQENPLPPVPQNPQIAPIPEYYPLPEINSDVVTESEVADLKNELEDVRSSSKQSMKNINELFNDLLAIKETGLKVKSDLEQFQKAGVIEKIKSISLLKADKNEIVKQIAGVKESIDTVRNDFQEDPKGFLWGLLGVVTGLLRKRFIKEGLA